MMSPQVALCKPGPSHAGPSPRQLVPEALAPVPRRTGPGPRHILISTRPGLVREIAAQPASTSLNPRDRRVTREHVCQGYVLAG